MATDWSKIGADRAYQNPQQATEAETGTYNDAVDAMTPEQKLPFGSFPKAPDPQPFGNIRRSSGGRSE